MSLSDMEVTLGSLEDTTTDSYEETLKDIDTNSAIPKSMK